jgi:hypothetical protein
MATPALSAASAGAIEPHAKTGIHGYDEFEVDLEAILRAQLPAFFAEFQAEPLTPDAIKAIPDQAKGAYVLYLDRHPVYAGKTDTRHGFRQRLDRHAWTIQGRAGLDPSRLSFKATRIMVFSAFDVEALLIAEMKAADPTALSWNNSGFGSNDPGRNRDGQQPAEFDKNFPVDIDFQIDNMPSGNVQLRDLVQSMKANIPYLIRNATIPAGIEVQMPKKTTVRNIFETAIQALPPGWQITVLHGRVVIYPERKTYDYKLEVMRS